MYYFFFNFLIQFEDPVAKPHRAPMYKSDAELLEEVRRENPQLLDTAMKKDEELYDRLKSVYVSSTDPAPDPRAAEKENRPLPRDVRQHYQVNYILYKGETVDFL